MFAFAMGFHACTTVPDVRTNYSPAANFAGVKTFAVLPLPTQAPGTAPDTMMRVAGPARQAIVDAMTAKGYREADRESADILVGVHGEVIPKTKVVDPGLSYAAATTWVDAPRYLSQPVVREYDQGTLAVEVFRNTPGADDLIWVGWTTRKRAPGAAVSPETVVERIHEILADFPPDGK